MVRFIPRYLMLLGAIVNGIDSLFLFLQPHFFNIYLFIHERHREKERQRHRQREKEAPYREPDVRLNPRYPGSCPGLKAALNR